MKMKIAPSRCRRATPLALSIALGAPLFASSSATAQTAPPAADAASAPTQVIVIRTSADASAQGLSPAYPGGQVARGGRAGILGTRDRMESPFAVTAYTNELIQDRQAKSVGDVLQAEAGVRTARGFGNFQEAYFIRGFILNSDDVAYNGLFSLLPRQYIATEMFERLEVLRGASAFLIGANPGGGGIGGAINLLPKRATPQPLARVVLGAGSGSMGSVAADVARCFGPDNALGLRVNVASRDGGTGIDGEKAGLGLASVGVDWRSRDVRLSADLGWQDNRLKQTRPNVALGSGVTTVPRPPDASSNFAQPWPYSNERDLFGTLRGEFDIARDLTAWAAYGMRRSEDANSLANLDLANASGAATTSRFDNTRRDQVDTGELGLRGKLRTGGVGHEWVASLSWFELEKAIAYAWEYFNTLTTNLYAPVAGPQRPFSSNAFVGGALADPRLTGRVRLSSVAVGDTLSLLQDRLLLTVGLRHQKLDNANFAYGTEAATDRYRDSRTSPAFGIVFKGDKSWSLYGNYIEGLTPGETAPMFGSPPPTNAGQMLAPYVSKQAELGAKLDIGRLGADVALFATRKPRLLTNSACVFTGSGEDEHRGLELNLRGEASRGVRVLGGFTLLDAKQKTTGSVLTEGKDTIGVPRRQASLGVDWELDAPTGLALDARVVYTGERWADAANTLRVPGWRRLDLGLRYALDIGGTGVALNGRIENATDRDHWASVGGYPGQGYLVAGAPRRFNLSAAIDF